ncbi:MAG TPA: DUF4190 domain-containing protein [Acidimicrobiales bacterium]|nr:DUF4190 domain-containing protein [Acidimicrobiales bacterium]
MSDFTAATPRTTRSTNGFAIASLVLSIVGFFFLSIILGPLGVIFGGIGLRRANAGASGRGMAIAGIVIGIVDIILFVILVIAATSGGFKWHI